MVRDMSREAYEKIQVNGVLAKKDLQVYNWLYANGPATGQEIAEFGKIKGAWKITSRLRRMGVARELEPRLCRVTKNYRSRPVEIIKGAMPKPLPKTKVETPAQKIKRLEARVSELEQEITRLRADLEGRSGTANKIPFWDGEGQGSLFDVK